MAGAGRPDVSFPLHLEGREAWVHRWAVPEGRAQRGVVHLLHGAGEHALRYGHVAAAFAGAGFEVFADDHLAHGETGLAAGRLGPLGRGQNWAALRVIAQITQHVRAQRPRLPLIVYGHSWGSLLAQQLLARWRGLLDGLVLTGTSLALPGWIRPRGLNAPFRPDETGLAWLSRDPAAREAFAADPLTFDVEVTPPWTPLGALQLMGVPPASFPRPLPQLPVLILAGSRDSISYGARGARALAACYRRWSGLRDVEYREYVGARHELVNERNREEVIGDMVAWLVQRWPAPRA